MGQPAASLANLRPWTSETAKKASAIGNQVRWGFLQTLDQDSPEAIPDHSKQLRKLNAMLARTDNPDRMIKLLDARAKLLKQAGQHDPEPKPTVAPAKPLRFLPKP